MYIYIYIYIERERDRERESYTYIYIYIFISTCLFIHVCMSGCAGACLVMLGFMPPPSGTSMLVNTYLVFSVPRGS